MDSWEGLSEETTVFSSADIYWRGFLLFMQARWPTEAALGLSI